jgi:hypothetical protein
MAADQNRGFNWLAAAPKYKPSQGKLGGFGDGVTRLLLGRRCADYVSCLEPFRALQQIELHGFAFIQCPVAVFLDCRKMNENIFPGGALDKPVSLRPVEPLDCSLLSHKELLSASYSVIWPRVLREAHASYYPLRRPGIPLKQTFPHPSIFDQPERLLSSTPYAESTAQSSGASRGCSTFDCDARNIYLKPELVTNIR